MAREYKIFQKGFSLVPKAVSDNDTKGDIELLTSDNKLYFYNGTINDAIVQEDVAATLTNKTLTAPVINNQTADTITAIAGGNLELNSVSTFKILLDDIIVKDNTISVGTGLDIQVNSASNQDIILNGVGTGLLDIQQAGVTIAKFDGYSLNMVAGNHVNFNDNDNSNRVGIFAPAAVNTDYDIELPADPPSKYDTFIFDGTTFIFRTPPIVEFTQTVDNTTTGSGATIPAPTDYGTVILTNASLTSITNIGAAPAGRLLTIKNSTGATVTITNDSGGTAANRIITGLGADIQLANDATLFLEYDGNASRWTVVGGSGGSSTSYVVKDDFTGDGTTVDFTLSATPTSILNTNVFINGVYQNKSAYTISGSTLTFSVAPSNGDAIEVLTVVSTLSGVASNMTVDTFTGDGSTVNFTLSIDPISKDNIFVFIQGVYQDKDSYSVSGTTLTFTQAPPSGIPFDVMIPTLLDIGVPSDSSVTFDKLSSEVKDLVSHENLAINGSMLIRQRYVTNTVTVNTATTTKTFVPDRIGVYSGGATVKNYTIEAVSDEPTVSVSGFQTLYNHKVTMVTGIGSFAANDYVNPFTYTMEGYDFRQVDGGDLSIGFWVKAAVTGTYNIAFRNGGLDRSYVTTFTINSANTWEYKTKTISVDSASIGGTWNLTNGAGLQIDLGLYTGSNYVTSTLDQWQTGSYVTASGSTNWAAANNNYITFALFSIVKGSNPYPQGTFYRNGVTHRGELHNCMRYYEKSAEADVLPFTAVYKYAVLGTVPTATVSTGDEYPIPHPRFTVEKRSAPTITIQSFNPTTNTASSNAWFVSRWDGIQFQPTTSTATQITTKGFFIANNTGGSTGVGQNGKFLSCGFYTADAEF